MKKTWIQGDGFLIPNCNAAWHTTIKYHIFGQTTIASKSFDYIPKMRTDPAHANAGRICIEEVQKRLKTPMQLVPQKYMHPK